MASVRYEARIEETAGTVQLHYRWRAREGDHWQDADCRLEVRSSPCPFGGRQWWWVCPYTGKRAMKLYKFGTIEKFCCRQAIRPTPSYRIERLSGELRADKQRWELRRKLGDPGCLLDPLTKPKWMRQGTFRRYQARDDELAELQMKYIGRKFGRMLSVI